MRDEIKKIKKYSRVKRPHVVVKNLLATITIVSTDFTVNHFQINFYLRSNFGSKNGNNAFQLKNIDFELYSGEMLAVTGPTGSGKVRKTFFFLICIF